MSSFRIIVFCLALASVSTVASAEETPTRKMYGFGGNCGWVSQQKQNIIAQAQRACAGQRNRGSLTLLMASKKPGVRGRPLIMPRLPLIAKPTPTGTPLPTRPDEARADFIASNTRSVALGNEGSNQSACTRVTILQKQLADFQRACR